MSPIAEVEGEAFGAAPKSCRCVKNCSKLLPFSIWGNGKKLMVDDCETGTVRLLEVSTILPEFSNFPEVNKAVFVN